MPKSLGESIFGALYLIFKNENTFHTVNVFYVNYEK